MHVGRLGCLRVKRDADLNPLGLKHGEGLILRCLLGGRCAIDEQRGKDAYPGKGVRRGGEVLLM